MTDLPRIELRNVRVVKQMSEETTCFTATLVADGVVRGEVSNRGCGGCHDYRFDTRDLDARMRGRRKTWPAMPEVGVEAFESDYILDHLVDEALDLWERREMLRKQVLALKLATRQVYKMRVPRGESRTVIEARVRRDPAYKLLADMPEAEALALL